MTVRRAAVGLWALAALFAGAAVVLHLLDISVSEERDRLPLEVLPAVVAAVLGFVTVGALVAIRLPRNPIGWLYSVQGVTLGAAFAAAGYADYALIGDPGALPGGDWAAWFLSWVFLLPLVTAPTLLFLLFPTGRAQSRAWGRVLAVAAAAAGLAVVGLAFGLEEVPYDPPVQNPVAIGGAAGDTLAIAATAGQILALLTLVASAVGMVLRLRRSRGDERVQLKWFAYAALLVAIAFPVAAAGPTEGLAADLLWLCALIAFLAVPLATGLAILRYRLYDIDVVINRTLVYGALTATLAAAYVGMVLLLGVALSPLTDESDLAIAGSTLVVAALFRPARSRIQVLVDRRFYRQRYDAARTLETFGARLRDEVSIDALSAELRTVVVETVRPAQVSLWLKGAER